MTQEAGTTVFLINCKKSLVPLGDEPLRLGPVFGVVVEEACRNLQRRSSREELAVQHTVMVNVSRKPSWRKVPRFKHVNLLFILCDSYMTCRSINIA